MAAGANTLGRLNEVLFAELERHDREGLRTAMLYARVTRARVDAERKARIAAGRPRKGDMD